MTALGQRNISKKDLGHPQNEALRNPYRILQNLSFPSRVIKEAVSSDGASTHHLWVTVKLRDPKVANETSMIKNCLLY